MDVLKPELLLIQGRCYRINPINELFSDQLTSYADFDQQQTYDDEDCILDYNEPNNDDGNEEDHLKCHIEITEGKKYQTAFHVPRSFFPIIIGTKHATRKRLENETKTEITIPKFGSNGDVCISGNSRHGVESAYRRILLITMTARKRQQFTHFVSIPFCIDKIKERFLSFKREILENFHEERGIEEAVFQEPEKLHMTLCVMVLSDEVERTKAIEVLRRCKLEVLDDLLMGNPLKAKITGVEIMNDDPAEAQVIYGKVHCDDEQRLQMISDSIVDYVAKAGVLEKEHDKVKMHITLMNSKFLEKNYYKDGKKNKITINAAPILEAFRCYDFGEITIDTIHLSQSGAFSADGYYKSSLILDIN